MRGICFEVRPSTYLLSRLAGKRWPALHWGPFSGLKLAELARPVRRGADWALVRVHLSGICGSDMAAITYKSSPALTPFCSFPGVLGHEMMGTVAETGPECEGFAVGDRVVAEPFLTCASRGVAVACEACREGAYCVCHNTAEGPMAPGMLMGLCRDQGGGWGEYVAVHRSQLFHLPDDLDDDLGVLVEPLSVGVHAVLRALPSPGSRVLVIGGGMMSYAVIAALALLEVDCEVSHLAQLPHQAEMGTALGARHALSPAGVLDQVVALTDGRRHRPIFGRDVITGGFEQVYDCVGSAQSLQDALDFTRARGTVVLVGAPGVLPAIDWTFLWARELTVLGTLGYGVEAWQGERLRTFALTMTLLQRHEDLHLPLSRLITHRFALDRYPDALRANLDRARTRSLKVVFAP